MSTTKGELDVVGKAIEIITAIDTKFTIVVAPIAISVFSFLSFFVLVVLWQFCSKHG